MMVKNKTEIPPAIFFDLKHHIPKLNVLIAPIKTIIPITMFIIIPHFVSCCSLSTPSF